MVNHLVISRFSQPQRCTLFPYTTLFRSQPRGEHQSRARTPRGRMCFASIPGHDAPRAPCGSRTHVRRCYMGRSEEQTSELQSQSNIVCRLLLEKKKEIFFALPSTPITAP